MGANIQIFMAPLWDFTHTILSISLHIWCWWNLFKVFISALSFILRCAFDTFRAVKRCFWSLLCSSVACSRQRALRKTDLECRGYMWNKIISKSFQPSSEIIVFQRAETCLNLFQKIFHRFIAIHANNFATYLSSLK